MLVTRDEYGLRRFHRRSVKGDAFEQAVRVYFDTTGGEVKTDASQIVYWAERGKSEFSKNGDEVHVLGLLRNDQIVGFALGFYLIEQRVYVVDHIAIAPTARGMAAFDRFTDLIEQYVRSLNLYVDYFVAEITLDVNEADPLLNADALTRLLQIKGFRVADCDYWTPSAERRPPYQFTKAKLLLFPGKETKISKAKLLKIISCLHDGLYQNWYKPFALDFGAYSSHLLTIYKTIEHNIGERDHIQLHGHPPMRGQVTITEVPDKPIILAFYASLAVALAILIAVAATWAGIGIVAVVGSAIASAICILAIASIWHQGAAALVKYAIDASARVFGKQK